MATPTTIRTLAENLMAKLNDTDDEQMLLDLLSLFEGIAPAELPIADLTKFLLTSDDNDDCLLLTSDQQDVWDKVVELLVEDADRIPSEPVIAALQHALEVVSDGDEEADSDTDTCLEQLASFTTVLPTFPADVLAALLAHQRAFVRMIGLDTLNELNREAEIVPYLRDPDAEVRTQALQQSWKYAPLATMQELAQGDLDDEVRAMAVKVIGYVQQYGQAPGVAGA